VAQLDKAMTLARLRGACIVMTPQQLRAARALVGWSRKVLAQKACVNHQTIVGIELLERNCEPSTIQRSVALSKWPVLCLLMKVPRLWMEARACGSPTRGGNGSRSIPSAKSNPPDGSARRYRRGGGNPAAIPKVKADTDRYALDVLQITIEIHANGETSLGEIAAELNNRGIPTARRRQWQPMTVSNLLARVRRLL